MTTKNYALLSFEEREAFRKDLVSKIPSWYHPYLHLAMTSLFGLTGIFCALFFIHDLKAWELLSVPIIYVISNMGEWRIHKHLLHHRSKIAPLLYDRHAPQHHRVYITEDMTMRNCKEFRLVLIPAYGIVLIFLVTFPFTLMLWLLKFQNIAALFVITTMGYVLSYEWLHLSYHLSKDSFIGRRWIIRRLACFHSIHHDPRLMQKWNFNVTIPLWDLVQKTFVRNYEETPSPKTVSSYPLRGA